MTVATSVTVRVPLTIRRRPGRKTVVTPVQEGGGTEMPTRADPALVKALARAFRYQRLLYEGRYASLSEMAAGERIDRGYLGRILQLTLLALDIIEAILDGTKPAELGLPEVLEPMPMTWAEQRVAIAASSRIACSQPRLMPLSEGLPVPDPSPGVGDRCLPLGPTCPRRSTTGSCRDGGAPPAGSKRTAPPDTRETPFLPRRHHDATPQG
jgi:hypothetical protein